jgi:phage terminase large subunit-like protein
VAEIAALLGEPFMPWQRYVADVAMEIDPDTGLLVYGECRLTVPRQSGKTTFIKAKAAHRAIGMARAEFGGPQNIRYTAQTRNDARAKMVDEVWPSLEESPLGGLFTKRLANGNEQLAFKNKSRWGINANTKKSGHGGTVDEAYLDEAFAHVDFRLEQAFRPAMITRPSPQLWVVSTAGDAESVFLWSKVKSGRALAEAGVSSGCCYFEWSADPKAPDYDPGSPDTWLKCMPAIGHTVRIERIAQDFASMELVEFERAYLNVWQEMAADTMVAGELWGLCGDTASRATNPVAVGVDVTPDRAWGSIGIAARDTTGGWIHLEVIDHREGTGWMVDRIVELRDRHGPSVIVLDPSGPAGGLLTELVARGVKVKLCSTRDHTQACSGLLDDIANRKVRHVGMWATPGCGTGRRAGR